MNEPQARITSIDLILDPSQVPQADLKGLKPRETTLLVTREDSAERGQTEPISTLILKAHEKLPAGVFCHAVIEHVLSEEAGPTSVHRSTVLVIKPSHKHCKYDVIIRDMTGAHHCATVLRAQKR